MHSHRRHREHVDVEGAVAVVVVIPVRRRLREVLEHLVGQAAGRVAEARGER